jgi:uncharacterized protein with ParB-like and HNH nuclease domain
MVGTKFQNHAYTLENFFSQPGRGFYVPIYQRKYSWDEENAEKLMEDIVFGTKHTVEKPENSIFLGTVILHDERNIEEGKHYDTPNLLTKIQNVVDGQQRITSIAILACVLVSEAKACAKKLREHSEKAVTELADELSNAVPYLEPFYSV